jgi:hypothetical protein
MGFMVGRVALGHIFPQVLQFSPAIHYSTDVQYSFVVAISMTSQHVVITSVFRWDFTSDLVFGWTQSEGSQVDSTLSIPLNHLSQDICQRTL